MTGAASAAANSAGSTKPAAASTRATTGETNAAGVCAGTTWVTTGSTSIVRPTALLSSLADSCTPGCAGSGAAAETDEIVDVRPPRRRS
jgi:hypothetical protein